MDKVTVIQADREAAASLVPLYFGASELWQSNVRAGYYDDGEIVQAFVKHRRATPAPDSEKLREVVAQIIRDNLSGPAVQDFDMQQAHQADILTTADKITAALGASL